MSRMASSSFDRDALPALIAYHRCGKADAEEKLLLWLHAYVGEFVRRNLDDVGITQMDRDDVHHDIVMYLCNGLPGILAKANLEQEPHRYVWKVINNRFITVKRALRRSKVLAFRLEEQEIEEFSAHHPWTGFPSPTDVAIGRELRNRARRDAVTSVWSFRFPQYSKTYIQLVTTWLDTGIERPHRQGFGQIPKVVQMAMIVHLRRSVQKIRNLVTCA